MKRSSGVLLHITSLPSPYGIGTLGKAAETFVDFLCESKQKYWQVLPLNPIGYGNSPYQSYSAFAGEPLLIDLDDLVANGFLTSKECEEVDFGADPSFVDFEKVTRTKMRLLKQAHESFKKSSAKSGGSGIDVAYIAFCKEEADWLNDYAMFMALKDKNAQKSWNKWDEKHRSYNKLALAALCDDKETGNEFIKSLDFWKFTQFFFRRQWSQLRRYANKNGVRLIGDIPIYASYDSADVWTNRELFQLDGDGNPTKVAGVPPDYFSETGQLWGNPLYDWDTMKADNYLWWQKRIQKATELFDTIRIDHFRAFDTYYAIPYGEKTAVKGEWCNGPGGDLFKTIAQKLPLHENIGADVQSDNSDADSYPLIIAEDLGELFDSVKELLKLTGFPGMKILQFGFNGEGQDNEHLSHNYINNMIVYTGTHDNSTINGFLKSCDRATLNMAKNYLCPRPFEPLHWACIRSLYASSAGMVLIPMQDILGLDEDARMNLPGTVKPSNWVWRMKDGRFKKSIRQKLKRFCEVYYR
ncbi:MAG: 4-alpha-glucanotransferase [Oscillospiraceae bacterium]|nr:4-alpha-glucanotransferase [Oscillospiraceae bacterium]